MTEEFKRDLVQEEREDVRRIALTQETRERLIQEFIEKKTYLSDPEMAGALIRVLDGMDRTALTRMKIKVEDKAATAQAQASSMVADILNNISNKKVMENMGVVDRVAPKLSDKHTVEDPVAGEKEIGTQSLNYAEFMEKNQDILQRKLEGQDNG